MSYKISSEKIDHPLLKPLLEELIPFFEQQGVKFFEMRIKCTKKYNEL